MTDAIDDLFNSDLEKLGKKRPPLELQINAAKVKAAQKPGGGAEKPDLGAPGKGKGGVDPSLTTASLEGVKSFGKLLMKNPKSAELDKAYAHAEKKTGKPRNQLSMKEINESYNALHKKASDESVDLYSAVGVHAPEGEPDAERPDVSVADQTNDRIDDHFVGWLQERADEDVVKIAGSSMQDVLNVAAGGPARLDKMMGKSRNKGLAIGAAATAATLATGTALYSAFQKRMANKGVAKTAAMQENDENMDLIARLKKRARDGLGTTNDA